MALAELTEDQDTHMSHRFAPVVRTDRLLLRGLRREDFEPFAAVFASDRARYMGGRQAREDAWTMFVADAGQWAILGFGSWAIEVIDTGESVGEVSLNRPVHFPENELGWVLWEGCEGHGYATEAARAARDFAFRELRWTTLVSYISAANTASRRVAERLGAVIDPDAPKPDDDPTVVYRHTLAD